MSKSRNSNRPRFSIIIPTYNATPSLRQCINSLYNQAADKRSFEIIIVNDGGNDEIPKHLVSSYPQLTIRSFRQKHRGPAAARNLGLENAKGEIILFLDDDSLPTTNWLTAVTEAWNKYPNSDGIGGYIASKTDDSIYCKVNSDFFNWYLSHYSGDRHSPFLSTCNAGYRKLILNRVGKFDEHFKKASGEDRDLNIRILMMGGRLRLDENILVHHDTDLSILPFIKKYYNYGKAAHTLYTTYSHLKPLSLKDYANCYISIVKKRDTFNQKIAAFLLLTLSQLSTFIGYHAAKILS